MIMSFGKESRSCVGCVSRNEKVINVSRNAKVSNVNKNEKVSRPNVSRNEKVSI